MPALLLPPHSFAVYFYGQTFVWPGNQWIFGEPLPGLDILICIWEKFGRRWAFFLFQSASGFGPQMRENLRRSSQSGHVIAPILSSSPSIIQVAATNFDWLWTAERKITQKSKLPPKTTYRRSE